jgi:hypothetical protein
VFNRLSEAVTAGRLGDQREIPAGGFDPTDDIGVAQNTEFLSVRSRGGARHRLALLVAELDLETADGSAVEPGGTVTRAITIDHLPQ